MDRISRRGFLERSLKLAGLTGFGGARLRELSRLGFSSLGHGPMPAIAADPSGNIHVVW